MADTMGLSEVHCALLMDLGESIYLRSIGEASLSEIHAVRCDCFRCLHHLLNMSSGVLTQSPVSIVIINYVVHLLIVQRSICSTLQLHCSCQPEESQ